MDGLRHLAEAEKQLEEYGGKVKRLRSLIPEIKGKIAAGEPWPGQVQESDRRRQVNG